MGRMGMTIGALSEEEQSLRCSGFVCRGGAGQ